jgi:hypothetical protein
MIKLIHKRQKQYTPEERRLLVIHYSNEIYLKFGRLNIVELNKIMQSNHVSTFGSVHNLIKEAGLPEDALYGSKGCAHCGKVFIKRTLSGNYCCRKCQCLALNIRTAEARRKKAPYLNCLGCGISYQYMSGEGGSRHCSKLCSKQLGSRAGNGKRRAFKNNTVSIAYSRADIIERDGVSCRACGEDCLTEGDQYHKLSINLDHIIPISKGGHNAPYNIQILCRGCNITKSNNISSADYLLAKKMWPEDIQQFVKSAIDHKELAGRKDSKSKIRGVCLISSSKKWRAVIQKNGKKVCLCYSKDINIAAKVRKEGARLLASGVPIDQIKEKVSYICQTQESPRL